MTQPAAIRASYANIKTVLSRSVCQIVLEIPIEGMQDAMALLGSPKPGSETWVAIARLKDASDAPPAQVEPPARKGTLAQQAGILCNEPAFRRYLAEKTGDGEIIMYDLDMAADTVRSLCGIDSRAKLDTDAEAAAAFIEIRADYKLWLSDVAA